MNLQKLVALHAKPPFFLPQLSFFLFFILISCGGGGGDYSFPSSKADAWCTYNVTFNEGTSAVEIEKQMQELENDIEQNTKSTDPQINCEPTATTTKLDDLHYQVEVTMNCFRVSDTSSVRPPSGTKPPPGRVTSGTIKKVGCPDDEIKK